MGKYGPKVIQINQFTWLKDEKVWTLNGNLHMTFSVSSEGKDSCETVLGAIGTAASKIPGSEFLSFFCMFL